MPRTREHDGADRGSRSRNPASARACSRASASRCAPCSSRPSPSSTRTSSPTFRPAPGASSRSKQENCTVCYKCSRECPDWCIYIDAHKESHDPAGGGRARSAKILDRFAIDYALCMYCGICVEVCPFDALFWSPEFEYATHELDELDPREGTARGVDLHRAAAACRSRWAPTPVRRGPPVPKRERPDVTAQEYAFCVMAVVGGLSSIGVVTARNVVHAALYLVVTLLSVGGVYLLLGAEFVAWVQILIYVGAIVILFLFGLMLTKAPIGRDTLDNQQRWLGAIVGVGRVRRPRRS